eukprot:7303196-Prorocentrum_lima.AAC.1
MILDSTDAAVQKRAWKLFIAFPKLLLATESGRGGNGKNGARAVSLTSTIGTRLRDWKGGNRTASGKGLKCW